VQGGNLPDAIRANLGRSKEYEVRIPARFYKDSSISLEAKGLLGIIVAHSGSESRETYIGNSRLIELMGRSRSVIERAMKELCEKGWLRKKPQRVAGGRWGPRFLTWQIPEPDRSSISPQRCQPTTVKRAPSHIPGQVRSPEEKSSCSGEELTDAQNSNIGVTETVEEAMT